MSVGVQREVCRKMPQHARYGFDAHTVLQGQRCEGVPLRYNMEMTIPAPMLMYGREAQSKTRIASPATIPKSGERNRKIHSCMLYLISI